MEEIGLIKSINGTTANVMFPRKSGCGGNCGGCSSKCQSDSIILQIENTLNLSQGDRVLVGVKKKVFSKMIFWAYIFPSVMFMFGLTFGIVFFKNLGNKNYELLGALTGFVSLLISYLLSGKIDKKVDKNKDYKMEMLKKVL